MCLFYCDVQEELDVLVDRAAGILSALCKGSGRQHQLGTFPISPERLMFLYLSFFSIPFISVLFLSSSFLLSLHCHLCSEMCPLFIASVPLLSSFLKSYYRSGSIPELLLTLLSNWKRSVKPRPAVSYVNCRPVQAASVCALYLHVLLLLPVFHSFIHSCFSSLGHWCLSVSVCKA